METFRPTANKKWRWIGHILRKPEIRIRLYSAELQGSRVDEDMDEDGAGMLGDSSLKSYVCSYHGLHRAQVK